MIHAAVTLVTPASDSLLDQPEALACLAFGVLSQGGPAPSLAGPRHLAFLGADALDLDLNDPLQRRFGDYQLLEKLGQGGMGVVYRARQESLDREVALKLLAAGPWTSTDFIERFKREAQSAARLQHPNIVPIFEIGSQDGLHFFSMRLVRGPSLAQVLAEHGAMAPRRAAQLLRTLAEALDYAHRLGVLHLDLKPGNVLVDEHGEPQVADFGLARRLDETLVTHDQDEVSGTPSYMAPEQAQARTHDFVPATDIYGLGAILYELLTGRPPFLAVTPQETLRRVVAEVPEAPRASRAGIPLDLERICLTCLAKEPAERYQSARALGEDLARFNEGRAVSVRPLNPAQRIARWARREPKFAAAALLALLALLLGLAATTQQWRRAESNAATSNERLWDSRRRAALRLEQDGNGFEALTPLLSNIEEQERAGRSGQRSIERREIGAILTQGVTLIDRMIVPDAPITAAELSPDGSLLALGLGDRTVRWYDTATLGERGRVDVSGQPTSADDERAIRLLRFAGNHHLRVELDWVDYIITPANGDTHLIDLDAGHLIAPPAQFAGLTDITYAADGRHALLHNRQHQVQLWQVDPWRPLSAPIAEHARRGYVPASWIVGPGAKYVLSDALATVDIYPPDLVAPRSIEATRQIIISAWAESNDGHTIAFGDQKGRIYLGDTRTAAMRQLPTPIGREVNWLAFSEDDAWLAAARTDGAVFAFDVQSGEPLNSGQMQHDFQARHVTLSHRHRLLLVSGPGELGPGQAVLWRLPIQGAAGVEATRILSGPTRNLATMYAVGAALDTGLLATAAIDGEVRLWRIAPAPMLPARAARQISAQLYFDGQHVVDVAYDKVRVVSTRGGKASAWVDLRQPVNFAELVAGGRSLVTVAGTELRVLDVATMTPRYAPLRLEATPMRLAIDAQGTSVVLAFGDSGSRGFEERLETLDLEHGEARAGVAVVKGPLRQIELSADGSRLLAVGPSGGSTDLFETRTLNALASYTHANKAPVQWGSFAASTDAGLDNVWLVSSNAEANPRANLEILTVWEASTGRVREQRPLQGVRPFAVATVQGRAFVAGQSSDALEVAGSGMQQLERLSRTDPTAALATSPGGDLVAQAFRGEVQLYDAVGGAPVGPPLRANLDSEDLIAQLAFDRDGRQLLARTLMGRWILWPVAAEDRALSTLHPQSEMLNAAPIAHRALQIPSAEEHARLRASDPGAWREDEARPQPATDRSVDSVPIPRHAAGLSPLLLDLTPVYTLAPDSVRTFYAFEVPHLAGFPLGTLRFDGIDYDVRGVIELRADIGETGPTGMEVPSRATGVRSPSLPIAAFHVLLFAANDLPSSAQRPYANLHLHYADGSEALVPILTQRDVPGGSDVDRPTPFACAFGDDQRLLGYQFQRLISNPRLANPHPERLVSTLDIETASEGWSEPAIFAITAEPVIPAADSRTMLSEQGKK